MTVILDQHSLTYVAVPKVACTSIKTMLFEVENGFAFQPFHANGRGFYIHNFYPSIEFGMLPQARVADHARLAVVRDPMHRVLSCYSNRVKAYGELSVAKAGPKLAAAGLPPDPELSTFIAHLDGYCAAVPDIRHHAQPQIDFLGPDAGFYTRLYNLHTLDRFVEDVIAITGRTLALERLQTLGPKISPDVLTPEQRGAIAARYAADYETFGAWF
jgi:hypothetical protein